MADYKTTDTELGSIANAIRTKGGTTASLAYPSDFISAINAIQVDDGSSGTISLQSKTVTSSTTTFTVSADNNYDGLSQVTINAYKVQTKTATSSTATQIITPDSSYNGLSQITISPYILQTKTVTSSTASQAIIPDNGVNGLSSVIINPYKLQPKAVTPSTVTQTIIPDSNFDGLSQVIVNAVSDSGGGGGSIQLQAKTATSSTATQTIIPDWIYDGLSQVTIDPIAIGTAGTPVATKGSVSNNQISITPTVTNVSGYIDGGTTNGTAITVSASELVSGTQTVTTNSTYDVTTLATMVVNVAGSGGGLTYESGTYITSTNTNRPTITFSNSHNTTPIWVGIADSTGTTVTTSNTILSWTMFDYYRAFGAGTGYGLNSTSRRYGIINYHYIGTSTNATSNATYLLTYNSDTTGTTSSYSRYYATATQFRPYSPGSTRYFRSGRTYKWYAIWGANDQ